MATAKKVKVRKFIKAEMQLDRAYPYSRGPFPFIPYVVEGNHPRFKTGTRFDYGFLQVALQDGYQVTIKPPKKEAIKQAVETYRANHPGEDTSWVTWA